MIMRDIKVLIEPLQDSCKMLIGWAWLRMRASIVVTVSDARLPMLNLTNQLSYDPLLLLDPGKWLLWIF